MVEITPVEVPAPRSARCPRDTVVAAALDALGGRTVWHVNTTAVGGGVAELLRSAIPRHTRAGMRARWLVMNANQEFFGITKQLHHLFHGSPGDGRRLGEREFVTYERTTREAAAKSLAHMTPGDLVLLHDPQTLGMAPLLRQAGMRVAWRSHIGTSLPGPEVTAAWEFLEPFLQASFRCVFSLPEYVPPGLDTQHVVIIAPAIDDVSDKCRPMGEAEVRGVLTSIGLVGSPGAACMGEEGEEIVASLAAYAARRVTVWQDEPLPPGAPTVLQLARWDPLKDMAGTLASFVRHINPATDAHLVLAGPDPTDVADDPENMAVFDAVLRERAALPADVRRRVHLVGLGLADDTAELRANAVVVNALQRHATVIAQKSLEEGFGLAVAEAMWKTRPLVASAVGGIRAQVTHEVTGLLVDDPTDLAAFGAQVTRLLRDEALRDRLGRAAHDHCALRYLAEREFRDHVLLYRDLCGASLEGGR
ncbi:glycosyltransferase [Streptomyces sp. ME19-01-6]|uniref:glycosyltransferase n=1 Tax=Streptomyces sp. ME19-01-6 TaxID=3028686 RepID=UPI00299FB2F7|nr:glycosyltransferase [Streptomyces sp. ME19-01-6]MDX3224957.1 glycosyltransferase [Streptomyces sp. ME19-01-6]